MSKYVFTAHLSDCYRKQWAKHIDPLAAECDKLRALEIGTHEGRSAIWLIERYAPNIMVECVDPHSHSGARERFLSNTADARAAGLLAYDRGFSGIRLAEKVAKGRQFDFIYVDGCHEAASVLSDGVLAFSLLRVGGKICFDDYWYEAPRRQLPPKPAIDAFLTCYDPFLTLLHKKGQVWIRKTRNHITT